MQDSHEIGHITEERAISLVFSLLHHPRVLQHLHNRNETVSGRITNMMPRARDHVCGKRTEVVSGMSCPTTYLGKDGVLVYGPVLNPALPLPDDLLVLLEPPI